MLTSTTVRLAENNDVDAAILQLTAIDLDLDDNGDFDYVIGDVTGYCADAVSCSDATSESSRMFHVDSRSGLLSVAVSLDREKYSHFRITILAVDHGLPPHTGSTVVEVVVDDVNDNQPRFLSPRGATGNSSSRLELAVAEDTADGELVGQLKAVDRDATFSNNRIYYYFRSSQMPPRESVKFVVDADTGEVRLRGRLDREHQSRYTMAAVATDAGRPVLSAVKQLVVKVVDVNDNDPVFEFPTSHNHTIPISSSLPLGHQITRVVARDPDEGRNGRVIYRLPAVGDNVDRKFTIQQQHGVVSINFLFDHVTYAEYRITVVAEDDGIVSRSATAQLLVVVNRSVSFPLPAGSRDPEVVHYNDAIMVVGVLTLAALAGLAVLILVVFARSRGDARHTRSESPLSAMSNNCFQAQQLTDVTPRSSTVR